MVAALAITPPPRVYAYPEMAGSCGRPVGSHLPNAADGLGDGGFVVGIAQVYPPGRGALSIGNVTLSHRDGPRKLSGFLLRAVDAETMEELGTFSSLPDNTMLYEGCRRKAAAVCHVDKRSMSEKKKFHRKKDAGAKHWSPGDPVDLPARMQLTWPADQNVRLLFWAVTGHHNFLFAQANTGPAMAPSSQTDPRLMQAGCTHAALSPSAMALSLCGLGAVAILGALPQVRYSLWLRGKVTPYVHLITLGGADYGLGGWSRGRTAAALLWMCAQGGALFVAVQLIPGFPLQATVGRGLGTLAAAGFCVVLVPVSRFSLWPRLLGVSYERAVTWHRLLGVWTLAASGVHGVLMINDYDVPEIFSTTHSCYGWGNFWGTLCGAAAALLLVLSAGPVRRRAYRLFHVAHILLAPAVIVSACLHVTDMVYWVVPPVILEVTCNVVARLVERRRAGGAELLSATTFANSRFLKLRLRAPHICATLDRRQRQSGWAAGPPSALGSWIYVSMRGEGWAEAVDPHPFSIAGLGPATDELSLLVKVNARESCWTEQLLRMVKSGEDRPSDVGSMGAGLLSAPTNRLRLCVEGPYGAPSLPLDRCSTLVCVGGGIGVTPLLPILTLSAHEDRSEDIDQQPVLRREHCLRELRRLVFVWVVRDMADFECAADILAGVAVSQQQQQQTNTERALHPRVDVHLHCTRTVGGQDEDATVAGHPVRQGRPDISVLIHDAHADSTRSLKEPGAQVAPNVIPTMAFVCGPSSLVSQVHDAGESCKVAVHDETFLM